MKIRKKYRIWKEKRRLKKDIKEYHNGRRDQMEIADFEKQEITSLYELKIKEKNAELDKRDEEIKRLRDTLNKNEKELEKNRERMIAVDSALIMIEKSNEVKKTMAIGTYQSVLNVVGTARHAIRREIEKLPKLQKKISENNNKVL